MRLVFDIEADDLLLKSTIIHCMVCQDVDTEELYEFEDARIGLELLDQASEIIGHNIAGYDLPMLKKHYGWSPSKTVLITDTLIISRVYNYMRFGPRGHSLDVWGKFLKYPKMEFFDFRVYSPKMLEYCKQDVRLNTEVYKRLYEEGDREKYHTATMEMYLSSEVNLAMFCAEAHLGGWKFDLEAAYSLYVQLESELVEQETAIAGKLGKKAVRVPNAKGEIEVFPKWTKTGNYAHFIAAWFDIDPNTGMDDDRLLENDAPYCKVKFEFLELTSVSDVKIFLFKHGWKPTQWNYKRVGRNLRKTSPKITEDSLEGMEGELPKKYIEYSKASSRLNLLRGWIDASAEDGRMHGDTFTIGTPSFRVRHKLLVNIPSIDSKWGPEMRALFVSDPGWVIVGADSSGNQARSLGFYLESQEYINLLLDGDIHSFNASKLTWALRGSSMPRCLGHQEVKSLVTLQEK